MNKTLPCEPPFGWVDEIPPFADVWNNPPLEDLEVFEEPQSILWEMWLAATPPTNKVTVREESDRT